VQWRPLRYHAPDQGEGNTGVSTVPSDAGAAEAAAVNLAPRAQAPHLPRQLSDAEFVMLRGAGPSRRCAAGEVLFRKGEIGQNMFVIESGQVRLDFGDGLPSKVLGPREYFGELALFIGNHARVAGAVAHTAANLRVIDYPAFDFLLENEPALLAQFMRRSFAYLVASEQQLIASLKRRNEDLLVTLDSLRQTQSQLSTANRLVRTDELTGLVNRRGLYEHLEHLAQFRVAGTHLALLLIDLDRFKRINDEFGHLAGDQVLCAVAAEVSRVAAACDLPCRIGGDEFALLAQLNEASELEALAARIVSGIRALHFAEPLESLSASISIGAGLCADNADWSVWYSRADAALYRAKGQGGNAWSVSTGD
jgi:diguanylate cyclase (GGDEF)-like protein